MCLRAFKFSLVIRLYTYSFRYFLFCFFICLVLVFKKYFPPFYAEEILTCGVLTAYLFPAYPYPAAIIYLFTEYSERVVHDMIAAGYSLSKDCFTCGFQNEHSYTDDSLWKRRFNGLKPFTVLGAICANNIRCAENNAFKQQQQNWEIEKLWIFFFCIFFLKIRNSMKNQ